MPYKGKKIFVVMPAYHAEKTVVDCYSAIPKEWVDKIILVDDASQDQTVAMAQTLPIQVIVHPKNLGYGGNQKTCYAEALAQGADIMIMVHPDNQYDPRFIPDFVRKMVDDNALVVYGSRMMNRTQALSGGMPRWKFIVNIILTKLGNLILETNLSEFHSGYRAYRREVFEVIDISKNSNHFVFDTEIIIQLADKKIPIIEIPISTKYFKEASQIKITAAIRYGCGMIFNLLSYRLGLKKF